MLNRKPLPRVSPSEVGLRADVLEEILDGLAARGEMHSLMIARHGTVCLEAFWAPYGPQIRHCLWSQTKSYTATAIGCLVDEGRLSLDEKVAELLAPYMPPEPCDNLRRMTVRDLLCMATGQHGPQNRTTPEWVRNSSPVRLPTPARCSATAAWSARSSAWCCAPRREWA